MSIDYHPEVKRIVDEVNRILPGYHGRFVLISGHLAYELYGVNYDQLKAEDKHRVYVMASVVIDLKDGA